VEEESRLWGREHAGTISAYIRSLKRSKDPVNPLEPRESQPRGKDLNPFVLTTGNWHSKSGVKQSGPKILHFRSGMMGHDSRKPSTMFRRGSSLVWGDFWGSQGAGTV
jgi:hypothetical protein